jgi:ABC-type dipeptide/oligopeptide/nickel transport system ATPase subunit
VNNKELLFVAHYSTNLKLFLEMSLPEISIQKNSQELHELFFELREEFDQTFVIVTHNKELAAMADRTLTMKDGNFVE